MAWWRRGILCAFLIVGAACSIFAHGPPTPMPRTYRGGCTDHYLLPAGDAAIATVGFGAAIAVAATSSHDTEFPARKLAAGALAIGALPFALGAVVGFDIVGSCREAKRAAGLPLTPSRRGLDAFAETAPSILAPSSFRPLDFRSVETETSVADLGVGGDIALQQGSVEVGVGARYVFAPGDPVNGHFLSVPLSLAGRISLSDAAAIRISGGVAIALGVIRNYGPDSVTVTSWGPGAELSIGYVRRLPTLELRVDLGVRSDVLKKGDAPRVSIDHVQAPFLRIGAGW